MDYIKTLFIDDSNALGCYEMYTGKLLSTFRKIVLPPYLGPRNPSRELGSWNARYWKRGQHVHPKISINIHRLTRCSIGGDLKHHEYSWDDLKSSIRPMAFELF